MSFSPIEGSKGSKVCFVEDGDVEPCAKCGGLLAQKAYHCGICKRALHWFCSEGDSVINELLGHGGHYRCKPCYEAQGNIGDAEDHDGGLMPCVKCSGLVCAKDYHCVGCLKALHWFCSEGDTAVNRFLGQGGAFWCSSCFVAKVPPPFPAAAGDVVRVAEGANMSISVLESMEQFNRLHELAGVANSSSKGGEGAAEQSSAKVKSPTALKRPRAKPNANAHRKAGKHANEMEPINRLDELEGVAKSSSKGGEGAAEQPYANVTKETALREPRAKPKANAHRKAGRNADQCTVNLPVPKPPAPCCVQSNWVRYQPKHGDVKIDMQGSFLDDHLSARAFDYVQGVKNKFTSKLASNRLEATEIHVFTLLMGAALDHLMGLTGESLNNAGLAPLSANEFRRFIGTLFLSSSFNLCVEDMFSLMDRLTEGQSMSLPRFREVLHNLKGVETMFRDGSTGQWTDQRNKLGGLHPLEVIMFERAIFYLYDEVNSALAYDDEMIGTKAKDIEVRSLSDRKAKGEGCTIDVLCDAHFQFMLAARLRTVAANQIQNMVKLLERIPDPDANHKSHHGPILVMDRGFGKMDHVDVIVQKKMKLITFAATLGSQHPFVTTTSLVSHREKLARKKDGSYLSDFDKYIEPWEVLDNATVLLGPEIFMAKHRENDDLQAVAIRDIFDKKNPQKILRFFLYGFPENYYPFYNLWPALFKSPNTKFPGIFTTRDPNPATEIAEKHIEVKSIQLTTTQRTADWFTLRCFHCTATMASQFISESFNNKSSSERFSSLLKSWFNRSRSTANMVVGAKNEDAVLTAFSTPNYVLQVLSCGLFESKKYPWLAASPDAIAVIRAKEERHYVCVVEIKTRTTESTIAEAELLLMKYNNKTSHTTSTGDDTWNDLVPPDHSNQILLQMLVTGCNHCCYICARPGTAHSKGRIIYQVFGQLTSAYANERVKRLLDHTTSLLQPFFTSNSWDELKPQLPPNLSSSDIEMVRTRWVFFKAVRKEALSCGMTGILPTSLFKTSYQCLYNSIKGGLDANTQQCVSIQPNVKVSFETKYIIRMMLAGVTNAWRAYQLLHTEFSEEHDWSYSAIKKKVQNSDIKLRKFMHCLAMSLIRSADKPIINNHAMNQSEYQQVTEENNTTTLGFQPAPETLQERVNAVEWPKRYKYKAFNRVKDLIELRLTKNTHFPHHCSKLLVQRGKHHCALCYHRQTQYGCTTCEVLLCRTSLNDRESCYQLWHTKRDIEAERKQVFKYHYKKKGKTSAGKATRKTRSNTNVSLVVPSPHQARSRKHRVDDEVVSEKRKKRQKVSDGTSSDEDDDYEGSTESDSEQEDDETDNREKIEQARDGKEEAGGNGFVEETMGTATVDATNTATSAVSSSKPVATKAVSATVSSKRPATQRPRAASKQHPQSHERKKTATSKRNTPSHQKQTASSSKKSSTSMKYKYKGMIRQL